MGGSQYKSVNVSPTTAMNTIITTKTGGMYWYSNNHTLLKVHYLVKVFH